MKTKAWFALILAAVVSAAVTTRAATVVLNFDDIPGEVVPMPAGYGGVNWAANMGVWSGAQDPYNPSSPPTRVLFNLSGPLGFAETKVSFIGGPHVFDGAYFDGSQTVTLNLYSGATLVATAGPLNLNNVPTFLPSGYAGAVTSIGFYGDNGFFAMDDFAYETIVPEQSTVGLLAIGFLASRISFRRQSSMDRGV